ncbi:MAG: hypothetical protein LCH91_13930 [Bacteroidetes bacterium]|nr:hypothetical protein [Bacteroidota bacterium]
MGILLAIVAIILTYLLTGLFVIYNVTKRLFKPKPLREISAYFERIAVAIDILGNVSGDEFWNDTMKKGYGYEFGRYETISDALSQNNTNGTLSKGGKLLKWLLNKIDKNHIN